MEATETEEWINKMWYIHVCVCVCVCVYSAIPHSSVGKPACNAGYPGLIPGLGRSLGEGNGNPLQYSCLESSMDREAWQVTVHGSQESDMT